jgi:hypothetical protein
VIFPFNFFFAAFAGAFLTTLLALPLWRKWCLRTNLLDDPRDGKNYDAPKIHTGAVPLAGGFAVLTGILLPMLVGAGLVQFGYVNISFTSLIAHGLEKRGPELAAIALGAVAITFLGWFDDKHELKPVPKLLGQLLDRRRRRRREQAHHAVRPQRSIQLRHHDSLAAHRHQRLQFHGQHERPVRRDRCDWRVYFCVHRRYEWRISRCHHRLSDVRRAGRISAVEFSERPRVSRRCRQPSRRLPARGHGDSAAFLHEAKSASARRARTVARAGDSAG